MSLVDDAVAVTAAQTTREPRAAEPGPRRGPVPCAARPGARLVHPDGRCQCFFGGPPPEFLGGAVTPVG